MLPRLPPMAAPCRSGQKVALAGGRDPEVTVRQSLGSDLDLST